MSHSHARRTRVPLRLPWAVAAAVVLVLGAATTSWAIVGGHPATTRYSFMVSIQGRAKVGSPIVHSCGGALLDRQWVLTARHCLSPQLNQVRVGSARWNTGGETVPIATQVPYPGNYLGDDIALIRLAHPVRQTAARIGTSPSQPPFAVRLIGWGLTAPDPEALPPAEVRELNSQVQNMSECSKTAGDGDVCVYDPDHPDTGSCPGDSGSPLLLKQRGQWRVIGVLSREGELHSGSCRGSSIYTGISVHRIWIEKTIGHRLN